MNERPRATYPPRNTVPDPAPVNYARCIVRSQIHADLDEMFADAVTRLDALFLQVARLSWTAAGFEAARAVLEALPLTNGEAALLRNRLMNARRYAEAGQLGAACYELNLLACNRALNAADFRYHGRSGRW